MVLGIGLAVLVGITLGLLGGGGSILTVPILVYAMGLEAKRAIATSLLVVAVTSVAAVIPHARAGRVRWRTAAVFGVAGMAGAYLGGRAAHFVPGALLLVGFGAVMLVAAAAMIRGRKEAPPAAAGAAPRELPVARALVQGAMVGALSGLVGAGGGFMVVPALVLLGNLPMCTAVGTSLVVIAMQSLAGFAGYLGHVAIDWQLAGLFTAAAVAGSVLGGTLAGRVPQAALRKAFAWFVAAMALYILGRQLPRETVAAHAPLLLAAASVVIAALALLQIRADRGQRGRLAAGLGGGVPAASRVPSASDHALFHDRQGGPRASNVGSVGDAGSARAEAPAPPGARSGAARA